jgi:hypothetical protein
MILSDRFNNYYNRSLQIDIIILLLSM